MTYRARCAGAKRRWTKACYRKAFPVQEGGCLGEVLEMASFESKRTKKSPRWDVLLLLPRGFVHVPERGAFVTRGASVAVIGAESMLSEIERMRATGDPDMSEGFDGSAIVHRGPLEIQRRTSLVFESVCFTSGCEEVPFFRPLGTWMRAKRDHDHERHELPLITIVGDH